MTGDQIAASLAAVGQRATGWLGTLPLKTVHNALCGVLALWLLYQLVQLASLFVAQPTSEAVPAEPVAVSKPAPSEASKSVSIDQLQALNLFGVAGAKPIPAAAAPVEEVAIMLPRHS